VIVALRWVRASLVWSGSTPAAAARRTTCPAAAAVPGIADQVDVRGMVVRLVAFERRQVVVRVADLVTGPASETQHIKRLMRRGNPRSFDYLIGEEAYGGRYF